MSDATQILDAIKKGDGNVISWLDDDGDLHLWRAPTWEEIHAAEAKDPPSPGYGGQGKAASK